MSAKEMFKKLGYECHEDLNSDFISYCANDGGIEFHPKDKTIMVEWTLIDMKLLQAINKQIEELDWE